MAHFVYILASRPGGAIYIGATAHLRQRVEQHRAKAVPGHTAKYDITTLVWFQRFETRAEALAMVRRVKRWKRLWKDDLIMASNPHWKDISADIPD